MMPPLPAAAITQKIEQSEQSAPGGDQNAGAQLLAHANQFCNSHN
jgi:hypothetical protein